IVDGVWQVLYEGIFRSNLVLQKVPNIDMDESQKSRILGEARFLRALYYWHLSTVFGKVPIIKEASTTDISKSMLPKSSVDEIYDFIINDLSLAMEGLPLKYSAEYVGRATHGAAEALLGKVYLYDKNYELAETHLGNVITSGEYELLD